MTSSITALSEPTLFLVIVILFSGPVGATVGGNPHVINFQSPNLYPESLSWDPTSQRFIVGSFHHQNFISISDAGVAEELISDPSLPENSTILGVSVDHYHHRLLAAVHSRPPLPTFNALAAYDLRSRRRLFLATLIGDSSSADEIVSNDVAFDFSGNAYVTNSAGNYIWKVTADGKPSILSRSPAFKSHPVDRGAPYDFCGTNGVVYISNGYLLVVQSNTGKLFKVNVDDGTARTVILNKKLTAADGIAVRRDGVVVVVSQYKVHFIKSVDNWSEGVVFDEIDLDAEGFATSVAIGGDDRVYVLYGHVIEGMIGNAKREDFSIVEMRSDKEGHEEESVWLGCVMIGAGLAFFMFWRFQMRQLVTNMNKKTT